ncbi:MAG: stage V sporulation protein SpoVM [Ruminococcus sp.]|nr:stage V sporulation protein SpoVM [Ruminococcus sp.]MBR7009022.1 stage V sporulation protein SpoVM [Ruminococcus sp.]
MNGGLLMKVVVVKSPKLVSGLLRFIFKIKKEDNS